MSTSTTPPRNLQEELISSRPFDLPEQEAYLNLVRSHAVLSTHVSRMLKPFDLSEPQYNALRIIAGAGRSGIHSEEVGKRLVALAPDTTRLVDRLVQAGLVERGRSETDRRCVVLTITPRGRALLRRIAPAINQVHRDQLSHLNRRQLEQFNQLLFLARHPA
jgi:DNA-binding MarR family transcriptional regulator